MVSDLFGYNLMENRNLLPQDGEVRYFGKIFTSCEAENLAAQLIKDIEWQNDQALIFGKLVVMQRLVAWYADKPYTYAYSGTIKTALPWTPLLSAINRRVSATCQESFNSCLLNLYPSGVNGMAWHSDAEKELKKNGTIASLSFGAERRFQFKHKNTKEMVAVFLESGSLLVMQGVTQSNWLHRLPKAPQLKIPRINLTFRQINQKNKKF